MSLSDFYFQKQQEQQQRHHHNHQARGQYYRGESYGDDDQVSEQSDMDSVASSTASHHRGGGVGPHSQALDNERDALLKAFYNYKTTSSSPTGPNKNARSRKPHEHQRSVSPPSEPVRSRQNPKYITSAAINNDGDHQQVPRQRAHHQHHLQQPQEHHERQQHQQQYNGGWMINQEDEEKLKEKQSQQWREFFHYEKPAPEEEGEGEEVEGQQDDVNMDQANRRGHSSNNNNKLRQRLYSSQTSSAAPAAPSKGSSTQAPRTASAAGQYFSYRSEMEEQVESAHYRKGRGGYAYDDQEDDDQFFRKEEKWLDKVEHEKAMRKSEFAELAQQECTFKPAINAPYKPPQHAIAARSNSTRRSRSASVTGALHQHSHRSLSRNNGDNTNGEGDTSSADGGDVGARLHSLYDQQLARRKEERKLAQEAKMRKHTFRPNIVRSEWTQGVTPRYLDASSIEPSSGDSTFIGGGGNNSRPGTPGRAGGGRPMMHRAPSLEVSKMLAKEEQELTFTPVTNRKISPNVSHYLRTPAHQRLSAVATNSRYNSPERITQEDLRGTNAAATAGTFAPTYPGESFYDNSPHRTPGGRSRSAGARRQLSQDQQEKFVERMMKSAAKRQATHNSLRMKEKMSTPFKPSIGEKSRKMAEDSYAKHQKRVEEEGGEYDRFKALSTSAATAHHHKHEDLFPPEPTFTPKIDRRSAKLQKEWKDHHEEVEARRKKRLERLAYEKEFAEAAELTFRPELSESAARSKGFIKKAIASDENFKTFMSQNRARRERDLRPHRDDLVAEEKRACTFKPEIHDAPEYVTVIANTLALTREERERTKHNLGHHSRPAWNTSNEVLREQPSPERNTPHPHNFHHHHGKENSFYSTPNSTHSRR